MAVHRVLIIPGDNLLTFAPGWQMQGIKVDNPSGSWYTLTTPQTQTFYIPPYSIGWSRSLLPTHTLDLVAGESPSGTTGSTEGTNITVTVSDYPVPDSDGLSYNPGGIVTLTRRFSTAITNVVALATFPTIMNAVAGIKYRILSVSFQLDVYPYIAAGPPRVYVEGAYYMALQPLGGGTAYVSADITTINPVVTKVYSMGLDTDINIGIELEVNAHWPTTAGTFNRLTAEGTYQRI